MLGTISAGIVAVRHILRVAMLALLGVLLIAQGAASAPSDVSGQAETAPPGEDRRFLFPFIGHFYRPSFVKGIALTYGVCADAPAVGARWIYTWSPAPVNCSGLGVESVPMFWGEDHVVAVAGGSLPLARSSVWVMGFNEPDTGGQANLTPRRAAQLWHDQVEPLTPGRKLVAPAVTQFEGCAVHRPSDQPDYTWEECPAPRGEWWLRQWYRDYQALYGRPPRMDALAAHAHTWWGEFAPGEIATWLKETMQRRLALAREWGIAEVWLTELSISPGQLSYPPTTYPYNLCQGVGPETPRTPETRDCYPALSQSQISAEAALFFEWARHEPMITRIAWFASRISGAEPYNCAHLAEPNHAPTPLCNRPLVVWGSPETAPVLTPDGLFYRSQ